MTKNELLKDKVLTAAKRLLQIYEEDIESGIKDGTYESDENVETRLFIANAKIIFDQFDKTSDEVFVYVTGGKIQGASATSSMEFTIYDNDDLDNADGEHETAEFIENNGTPEDWDKMIDERTRNQEITGIY